MPLALLIAGVAVPALILRLTSRPLAWAGLVIAAAGMLVAVSVLLPVTRHQVPAGGARRPAPAAA